MILPVADRPINGRVPWVTMALIVLNTLIFFVTFIFGDEAFYMKWALVPARSAPLTFLTYQFLHGGVEHLVGNMLFLWFFGFNTERRLGPVAYLVLYLLLGVIAGGSFIPMTSHKEMPLVGASGSIAGLMGLYMVLFPRRQIRVVYWMLFYAGTFHVGAFWFGLVYIAYQLPLAIWMTDVDPVAYWAHIGGAVGALVILGPLARVLEERLYPITESEIEDDYAETYSEFNYVPEQKTLEPEAEAPPGAREVETRIYKTRAIGAFGLIPRAFVEMTPELEARLRGIGGPTGPPRSHCLLTTVDFQIAQRFQAELERWGIKTLVYPAREVLREPTVVRLKEIQPQGDVLVCVDEFGQVHTRGTGSFRIVVTARVGDRTAIDLVARKPITTMRWSGEPDAAIACAGRIAAVIRDAPFTRSFQELASNRTVPARAFAEERVYNDYVLWATQLVSTPVYRVKRASGDVSSLRPAPQSR